MQTLAHTIDHSYTESHTPLSNVDSLIPDNESLCKRISREHIALAPHLVRFPKLRAQFEEQVEIVSLQSSKGFSMSPGIDLSAINICHLEGNSQMARTT